MEIEFYQQLINNDKEYELGLSQEVIHLII